MAEASRLSKLTIKKRHVVIEALRDGLSVTKACQAAGISRQSFYAWRANDPEFALEAEDAREYGVDQMEDEARRRAMDSSDTLLIFLLKSNRPEKFRETQRLEHTGAEGAPLTVVIAERSDGPQ